MSDTFCSSDARFLGLAVVETLLERILMLFSQLMLGGLDKGLRVAVFLGVPLQFWNPMPLMKSYFGC